MTTLSHKDLIAWRKSIALASAIHALTGRFPNPDRDALAVRMRRCALAVASTIAEGAACSNRTEYIRFLHAARGLLCRLEAQVCVCLDLKLIPADTPVERQIAELAASLSALIHRLREHRDRARSFAMPAPSATGH